MSFFRQPPKDKDQPEKSTNEKRIDEIFQVVEDNFKYKERNRAGFAKVTAEREKELLRPNKSEAAGDFELAYMKGKIAKEFLEEISNMKKRMNSDPVELIGDISKLIDNYVDLSQKVRSNEEWVHSRGGTDYMGIESTNIGPTSNTRITTRASGDLEKNFSNVKREVNYLRDKYNLDDRKKNNTNEDNSHIPNSPRRRGS